MTVSLMARFNGLSALLTTVFRALKLRIDMETELQHHSGKCEAGEMPCLITDSTL